MASKKDVSKDSAIEDPSSSPLPTMSQLDKLFEEAADAAEARASRGSQSSKTSKANGTITLDDDEEDDGYEYPPNTLSQEFMGHAPPRLEPFYEYSSQEEEDKRVEKEDSNKTSPKTGNRKRKTPTPVGIKHRMEKKKKKTSRGAMTALKLQPRFDAIAAAATAKEQETGDKPQQDQDVTEPRILLQHVGVVYKNCTFNITGNYVADASGSK